MTTTPEATKGVPRHEGNSSFTPRADHNALADWVRDHVGETVDTASNLPAVDNWFGRKIRVANTGIEYWYDGDGWNLDKPELLVLLSGSGSIPNGTVVKLGGAGTSYVETIDRLGFYEPLSNPTRVTPSLAGVYRVSYTESWSLNATGIRNIRVVKNNVPVPGSTVPILLPQSFIDANGAILLEMNGSTDYLELQVDQNSGSALTCTFSLALEYVSASGGA